MVLQLEDCTNVFKALYPQFDIVYELDHSSGHDKEKAHGLTTTPSVLGWEHGGRQHSMRALELGVNNAWGYSKLRFRRGINDAITSHLEENVKASMSREVLTINQIRKFARKAQYYKLTYSYLVALADGEDASAAKVDRTIEHLTKLFKQHRSALGADYKFIADS